MYHILVPPLIAQQHAAGHQSGAFDAVCLFVDTSGFTPLASAMMAHAAEGAEAVADALTDIFNPLVEVVYAHGGFVAAFAGDAFKAVFPLSQRDAHPLAVAAAWQIRRRMAGRQARTPFGTFDLAVKVTVTDGQVTWGVWQAWQDGPAEGQRAAYWFEGEALARGLEADPLAAAGEVVLTDAVLRRLRDGGVVVEAEAVDGHWRVLALEAVDLPAAPPQPAPAAERAPDDLSFYPADLLTTPVRGEFRQVVTVFVNLPAMPEDGAFARALFRLLAGYRGFLCRVGRIGERDRGATLLLFWGAPLSHENDLARALGFVLDLQRAVPSGLALRAGVTSGLAYAGFIGSAQREEYTCHGVTVNLAARLMITAAWGQIWLDEETARLAQPDFELELAGQHRLKGFAGPRPLFRLAGRREVGEAALYRGALVGRTAELTQLQAALQPLARGRCAGVITLLGEAGLGKSRLAHALRESTIDACSWFYCPCDDILPQSLHPFRHWLRHHFDQAGEASADVRKTRFDQALEALIASTPEPALADELQRTRSVLGALVELRWEGSLYEQLDAQGRFDNTLLALKTLIKAESLRQPLVLHVEDVHWLDTDSRQFLTRLVRNVTGYPFAVLLTARLEWEPLAIEPAVPQHTLVLEPLPAADLAHLADALLGQPAAPELVALLAERAEGNPFFAGQLLLFLRENGLLAASPQGLAPAGGADAVPLDVRSVLVARIDRLAAGVRRVVQAAAVLGREFELHLLAAMLRNDPQLGRQVADAEDAAVWTALSELRYLFRHALLRDAAYQMQLLATRRSLHRLAGEAIETLDASDLAPQYGQLAYHFEQAAAHDKARHYLRLAGERAKAAYQNDSALDYYGRLLRLLSIPGAGAEMDAAAVARATVDALVGRGSVLHTVGRWLDAEADLEIARTRAAAYGDEMQLAQAEYLLGYVHLNRADFARAIGRLENAAAHFERSGATEPLCLALNRLGQTYWRSGQGDQAMACHSRALALARAHNHRSEIALSLMDLGTVHMFRSEFEQSLACFHEGLRIYEELGQKSAVGSLRTNLGIAYSRMGNDRLALENYQLSLALSRELGYKIAISRTLGNLGTLFGLLGQPEQAAAYYLEGLAVDEEQANEAGIAWHLANLGEIYAMQGKYEQALDYLDRGITILRSRGTRHLLAEALDGKGNVLFALERFDEARAVQQETLDYARQIGHSDTVFQAQILGARLSAATGDIAAAAQALNALAGASSKDAELAAVDYELWRLDGDAGHRDRALALYQALAAHSAVHTYHSRLQELQAAV